MYPLQMLAKCPLTKCPLTKCPLAKRPLAKCPLAICPDTDNSFAPNPLQLNPGYAIVYDYLFLNTEVVIKAIMLYLDLVSFAMQYPTPFIILLSRLQYLCSFEGCNIKSQNYKMLAWYYINLFY